jgi:hypothetical protein
LWWGDRPSSNRDHQSLMERPTHFLVCNPWRPSQSLISFQTRMVNRQLTKSWSLHSVVCLQIHNWATLLLEAYPPTKAYFDFKG